MDNTFWVGFWAWVWFVVAGGLFLLTFIIGFKKQRNLKAALKTFLLGIVIVDFIMLSSLIYYGNVYTENEELSAYNSVTNKDADKPFALLHSSEFEITSEEKLPFAIIYGFINAPKMGAFGLKYSSLFDAAYRFPWCLGVPFGISIIILTIVTPLIFGGFLVSYIKKLWDFLAYHLQRRIKDIYYFSDLNEKSMLLAESIIENEKKKPLIVFCNWDKVPGIFADRIDRNHFIVLPENEKDLIVRFTFGRKKQYFFEISDDDNLNLESTNKLINRLLEVFDTEKSKIHKLLLKIQSRKENVKNKNDDDEDDENKDKNPFDNLKVYLFMDYSLFGSEQLFESKQDKDKINVILVNEVKASVYQLLFDEPLCEHIDDKTKEADTNKTTLLSIAVFGDGAYAKEFFKDSIWASVLGDKYSTKISFIDNNAESFENNLRLNCPALFTEDKNTKGKEDNDKKEEKDNEAKENNDKQLNFYKCDLQSEQLNEVLKLKLQHPDYIVIDTGNDEQNIKLAINLRMFYIRQSIGNYVGKEGDFAPKKPFIAVRIKNSKTATRIENLKVNENFEKAKKEFEKSIKEQSKEEQKLNKEQFEKKKNDLISYDFYSFGSEKKVYAYESIIDSPIEDLALNCYAVYKSASEGKEDTATINREDAVSGCNMSGFDKYSNKAIAVHIKNKLFIMGLKLEQIKEGDSKKPDQEVVDFFEKAVKNEKFVQNLAEIEHERWVKFNFAEGWKCPTKEERDIYSNSFIKDNPYKFGLARFHASLCLGEDFEKLNEESEERKIYSRSITIEKSFIKKIRAIIGYYDKNYKHKDFNISGIDKFVLTIKDKVKELSPDKLQETSPYQVISGDEVRKYFKQALKLDEKYYGKGNYTPVTEQDCNDWLKANKDIYTMIINKERNELLGYINAAPVMDTCYENIKNGDCNDANIECKNIKPYFVKSDDTGLFLISFVVDKDKTDEEKRDYTNLLINAFCNKLTALADRGFIITKIISYIVGVDNYHLADDFGMKQIPSTNSIYEVELSSDCNIPNPDLKEYQKHLKEILKN